MNAYWKAYLAGMLDGDGSIMLQLKPRKGMKYLFRVKCAVIFYQDSKLHDELERFRNIIKAGYVYRRND